MKKIALILPYFGKLPDFFQVWLDSCRANPTIDWLVFTDDESAFDYPPNVRRTLTTFEALRKRIQTLFPFPICLPRPYKLCDYKCAYGLIFKKELIGYDFWGYCDCDLVWGDIRKFVTDSILEKYDRIFSRGHLTLIRNNDEGIRFFTKKAEGILAYEKVFSSPEGFSFDEWNGTSLLWKKFNDKRFFDEILFDDITYSKKHFVSYQKVFRRMPREPKTDVCFIWKNGTLKRYFRGGSEETLYAHFQKRPLRIEFDLSKHRSQNGWGYIFIPDAVLPFDEKWETDEALRHAYCRPKLIYFQYWRIRLSNLKKKILKRLSIK